MIDLTTTNSAGSRWRRGDTKRMTNLRLAPRGAKRPLLLHLRLSIAATNWVTENLGPRVNVYRDGWERIYLGKGDDRLVQKKNIPRGMVFLGVWSKEYQATNGEKQLFFEFSTDVDQDGNPVAVFSVVPNE